ncbi:MAG: DUF2283 domain-containing protein [Chloroflexi bacterium]|jgi:uncharacterized protein YuzE|nr:DUF2283 domain-containing protein [Chloroflexota bacterium]MDP6421602.1 DUF2283 domain-containing protein [SAR202 cluster bacterium]HAL46848.1 DUF2283 domain-containing protein [Dehalococcoidia bacterium]MDP6664621.1 DUF2283 domain-containing protein [SAR202 cluster bacterium]MDP6798518.1 DUF2283 domain-containing protein [SAR202 cluster bacterium]|tara:strand:+ start:5757 stop:5996 length:240 start_codon:yes stop_codon:yes gene_type:complete
MGAKLIFSYDRASDTLYIDKLAPYAEQQSQELGDDIVVRINPATGGVENLEVMFFSSRLLKEEPVEIPIDAELRVSAET